MQEIKDPAIKLFGQKIPFPGEAEVAARAIAGVETSSPVAAMDDVEKREEEEEDDESEAEEEEKDIRDKDLGGQKVTEEKKEADPPPNAAETKNNNNSGIQNPKTPSIEEETAKSENAKSDNDETDAAATNNNPQEKTLKKPDKILPCPRCNSMDTKFCYYNNYNISQPRYFCKACQRYWTAGGTMRNVPVGAGRRKNKNSSHYRHVTISEALQAARIGAPNGTTHHIPSLKTNGRVLSFGLDHPPICDSMATVLNLADKKKALSGTTRNGFHSIEETKIASRGENGDDRSSVSSMTVSNSMEESGKNTSREPLQQPNNGFLPQVPCISSVPWPYPWSSAVPSPPAMCPPGYPMSFYPAAFWNVPWFPSHPYAPNPRSPSSGGPNSPTLGKHSRDDDDNDMVKQDDLQKDESPRQRNGCVLVPKTLRIDDPNEAAKSSIWATLGIKNECVSRGGMIKAFQSKKSEKNHVVETSPVLMANPAALSRSLNFHENS